MPRRITQQGVAGGVAPVMRRAIVVAPVLLSIVRFPYEELGRMSAAANSCIFCDLINGAGEVSICYEDSSAIAFMDIQPVNLGHVLVVPREHYESLSDTPPELAMHLFDVALRLSPVVRRLNGADDMNLVVNSGSDAGQNVFHHHVHLIPRKAGDGFEIPLPFPGSSMPDRTLLDAMAVRIIAELRDPVRQQIARRLSSAST